MSYSQEDYEFALKEINSLIDSGLSNKKSLHIATYLLEHAINNYESE
jgi:hypothetical protein